MNDPIPCARCRSPDGVSVVSGEFQSSGVTVYPDGFSLSDAKQLNTCNERVYCAACGAIYPLAELYEEDA